MKETPEQNDDESDSAQSGYSELSIMFQNHFMINFIPTISVTLVLNGPTVQFRYYIILSIR